MRMSVKLKFNQQWTEILNHVAAQCNMSVDKYCERAVMLITKQGLESGAAAQQAEQESLSREQEALNGRDDTTTGVTGPDTTAAQHGGSADTDALPDPTDTHTEP